MKKYIKVILVYLLSLVIVGITVANTHPQVNTVGLIAHYKMWDGLMTEGEIFDYTCTGKDGTLVDTDATLIPTYPGFNFTPNDYISIDDHDDFSPGNSVPGSGTSQSISVWVYMHSSVDFIIASKGILNIDLEWWFYLGAGSQLGLIYADDSILDCYIGRYYSISLASREDEWIHLVGTSDGGTASSGIKLYLNGVQIDNTNLENNTGSFVAVENLNHDVWIGRYDASYADGLIDDMMFFGKELSVIEIRNIYEVTRWRYQK